MQGEEPLSKLRVNVLWGKHVQADHSRHRLYLDSLTEYLEVIQSPVGAHLREALPALLIKQRGFGSS
jgi:hypothetical protein